MYTIHAFIEYTYCLVMLCWWINTDLELDFPPVVELVAPELVQHILRGFTDVDTVGWGQNNGTWRIFNDVEY